MRDKADHTRGWLRTGDSDINAAQATIDGIGPYDTACFHAQQAVEKDLKALIAYSDCQIPRSHNLEELERVCEGLAPTLDLMGIELAELTTYAVQVRYDFEFWPERVDAEDALQIAMQVRTAILAVIPKEAHP